MASLSWFDSLEPALREWLRSKMEPLTLESGQRLFAAGEPSDCLGLVTRRPRSATVRALRDSALLRLNHEGFDVLCRTHPEAVLELTRVVLDRAQRPIHQRLAAHPRTIALLPQRDGLHLEPFAARAASSLVLTPPVSDIDLLDWDSFDKAVERGYESTCRALEEQR